MKKFSKIIFYIFCIISLYFILSIFNEYKCIRNKNYFDRNKKGIYNDKNVYDKKQSIFCIILTQQENLETKAKTILETWGEYCDNLRY